MIKTFTHNELLLYVYDELPKEPKQKLERTLRSNQELAEECAELLTSRRDLERIKPTPSNKCISNILMYSQTFNMQS